MSARSTSDWSGLGALLLNLGIWATVAAVTASDVWLGGQAEQMGYRDGEWLTIYRHHLLAWASWPVITWIVFRCARRFPPGPGRWLSAVGVQALIAVPAVALSTAWWAWTVLQLQGKPAADYPTLLQSVVGFRLYIDFFLFGVIALAAHASRFYLDSQRAARRQAELAELVVRAELAALKSQLNPHFLFNTLNSIAGLVRTGNRDQALTVLAGLSELLRYCLETGDDAFVPLARELDFLQTYLMIQQVRFGDRLALSVDVDETTKDLAVPGMLLQPLVENALTHGAESTAGPVDVDVSVTRDASRLRVEIENPVGPDHGTAGFGIGLGNTRARLDRLYGDRYELALEPTGGGRVRLRLALPTAPG